MINSRICGKSIIYLKNIKEDIIKWSKTTNKKYYGTDIVIGRGNSEMTEYTSL